jgi:uncharacterized protein YkwD
MPRTTTRAGAFLALLALALGGLLTSTAGSASAALWKPVVNTSLDPLLNLTEYEDRVLVKVNRHRRAAGLEPVRYFQTCVDGFAERWAAHLAASGELVHRDQHRILDRCNFTWAGETLVRGTALTPGEAVRAWMNSPTHRAVLMKPRANRAGIGVRIDLRGRVVGVLNFGDVS